LRKCLVIKKISFFYPVLMRNCIAHNSKISKLSIQNLIYAVREVGKWGGGEVGRWGSGEVGRWGSGEVGRWGSGEVGKLN
jgi:hypothetical protein